MRRIGTYPGAPNRIGMYPIVRDGAALMLTAESRLEMAWLRRLDINFTVDWMQTQPLILVWQVGERGAYAFPDGLVRMDGRWVAFDVKPDTHIAADPHAAAKFRLTGDSLAVADVGYIRLGDMSQQAQVNLRVITRYRRLNPSLLPLVHKIASERPRHVGTAVEQCADSGLAREVVLSCIAQGWCEIDLDCPITKSTALSWLSMQGGVP